MTEYFNILFNNIKKDNGKIINKLIDSDIINYKEVLENLLKEGTSDRLYLFAKYINKVSKEEKTIIANELIRRKAIVEIFNFARNVEDAPIELLESVIIDSKIGHYIFLFAKEVKGANINNLEKAIINLKNAEYIYRFTNEIKGANIYLLEKAIITTNNAKYICLFAMNIPGANLELLEEALIIIGNLNEYQRFLDYKKKLQDEQFQNLNISLNDDNREDLEKNKDKYAYLFKEPSTKAKSLIKKIADRGY